LGFDTTLGPYPETELVGPPGTALATLGGCSVSYRHEPGALNGAVHLTGIVRHDAGADAHAALSQFLGTLRATPWVGVQVLAYKRALLARLERLGFELTAYLPAWFPKDGHRYDCVMLVKTTFLSPAIAHGLQGLVDGFRRGFASTTARPSWPGVAARRQELAPRPPAAPRPSRPDPRPGRGVGIA
jgi:hypothetical protein